MRTKTSLRKNAFRLTCAMGVMSVMAGSASAELKEYPSRYYTIYSDLDEQTVREAELRISRVAEEYERITAPLGGAITKRLPFYLFRHQKDYIAAGGLRNSAGVYDGERLMAVAGDKISDFTWKIIQHEGFHQVVDAKLPRDIPVWMNEGMAEYFEEAVFTGDRLVTGLIPPKRLRRIRNTISGGQFKTIPEMMQIKSKAWNKQMSRENYDQAWSMIYFLAHGDDGNYQKRLNMFLVDMGKRGLNWERAWVNNFGRVDGSFEDVWKRYWLGLPEHPSRDGYAEATVLTLTNFLARAHAQEQSFANTTDFFKAAHAGNLKMSDHDWLPPYLLESAAGDAADDGSWALNTPRRKPPTLTCRLDNGTAITGAFTVRKGRVDKVWVTKTGTK